MPNSPTHSLQATPTVTVTLLDPCWVHSSSSRAHCYSGQARATSRSRGSSATGPSWTVRVLLCLRVYAMSIVGEESDSDKYRRPVKDLRLVFTLTGALHAIRDICLNVTDEHVAQIEYLVVVDTHSASRLKHISPLLDQLKRGPRRSSPRLSSPCRSHQAFERVGPSP